MKYPAQNPILEAIISRRSIRRFSGEGITDPEINFILEAGRWAPSGLNNQPWRFCVIQSPDIIDHLATLTKYTKIIRSSAACIAVFYHVPSGYNRDKDMMGIGACIQNMLLAIHSLELGAVWLGEILNRKDDVRILLGIDTDCELAAVIALGHGAESPKGTRKKLTDLIIG